MTARICALATLLCLAAGYCRAEEIGLANVGVSLADQSYGRPARDRSAVGHPLKLRRQVHPYGLGVRADFRLELELSNATSRLHAWVGVDDDEPTTGTVEFRVAVDGEPVWSSGPMKRGDAPKEVDLGLYMSKRLVLEVKGARNCHADWADAVLEYHEITPRPVPREPSPAICAAKPAPAPQTHRPARTR